MVFSPDYLKGIQNGLGDMARPCHYVVFITPPAGMLAGGLLGGVVGGFLSIAGSAEVSIMAEAASIPGKQIATTPFTMYGTTMKMPYGTLFEDFNVTFMCSKSMVERTFFDVWTSFIHNPHNNYMNYLDNYSSTIVVVKLIDSLDAAAALNVLSVWKLEECFPVTVSPQELSYASDDYMRLNVSFAYRKWTSGVDSFVSGILPGPDSASVIPDLSSYATLAISLATTALANTIGAKKDAPFGLTSPKK